MTPLQEGVDGRSHRIRLCADRDEHLSGLLPQNVHTLMMAGGERSRFYEISQSRFNARLPPRRDRCVLWPGAQRELPLCLDRLQVPFGAGR
jgi:hypothetical protein